MNKALVKRMNAAISKIGGAAELLAALDTLPGEVKEAVINCRDYETRVKMIELIADQVSK